MALVIVIPLITSVLLAERHWRKAQADCLASLPHWRAFYSHGKMREEIEALAQQMKANAS